MSLYLVTGAAGWLGSRLVECLARGLPDHPALSSPPHDLRIRCLVLPGQDAAPLRAVSGRVEVVAGDLQNPADCARFCEGARGAVLFHTAGIIHPRRVAEFYRVNVDGAVNLLQAAAAARVRRTVVMSSNSPCGCNPHPDHLFDEYSPYNPYMHYGRSKMLMEQAVAERARNNQGPSFLNVVTYRYRGHSMSDPDVQRNKAEIAEWRQRD
ncbi:MAG TPA: NAD-dependent epimerase/dehydratase family protein, partial [Candidatus Paceibacterota bacterium]|nr:NAD-dependent epimerase/dehydratase family protein [Candidatus Paceibacterota bacterium]